MMMTSTKGVTTCLIVWCCSLLLLSEAFVPTVVPHHQHHQQSQVLSGISPSSPWTLGAGLPHHPGRTRISSPATTNTQLLMVSYEDLMEQLPSPKVIDAVEAAPGTNVIASDVAATAGISLSEARKELTALASISQGDIAVDRDGELIYSFPNNLNGILSQNSAKFKSMQLARKVWPAAFWFIRVSFGVALLASLAAIFSTILFLQTSGSSSDDNRRRDDRGYGGGGGMRMGGGFGGFWGPSPFDFFYYRPYGYYGVYGRADDGRQRRDPDELGFFESIFSYIFGDGDPNNMIEETRLQLVANLIRDNNGAVTAEQLAPFCDDPPEPSSSGDESAYVDESFVLPLVTALDGEPVVTEDGDIVYVFPNMQLSAQSPTSAMASGGPSVNKEGIMLRRAGLSPQASSREIAQLLQINGLRVPRMASRADLMRVLEQALPPMTEDDKAELAESDPTLIQEREYKFSVANDMNKLLAGGLGVLNLGGALYLGNLLAQYAAYGVRLPSYYGLVQAGYPFLLVYALLYNVIPLVRNFWIGTENGKIQKRNKARRSWKTRLGSATSFDRVGRKLQAAKKLGMKIRQLGASARDIIFDTKKPIESLSKEKEDRALEEFDKELSNGADSAPRLGATDKDPFVVPDRIERDVLGSTSDESDNVFQ